jgi:tRNA (guanine37-N1)-methyltransferase
MPMSRLLKRVLEGVLTPGELEEFIAAFDIIGDIAIIKVPESLLPKAHIVAERLLSHLKYIKSVYRQSTPVSGRFRVRGLEHLAGETRTTTLHKEYGCTYKVDIAKVFFSPRLATERSRVASLVREGEVVANLFAGVGPFSILIAKRRKGVVVHSIEANPEAYSLMLENIALNKVDGQVIPHLGDAEKIAGQIANTADRVLMPHPEESEAFIEAALKTIKPKAGTIHYYTFTRKTPWEEAQILQSKIPLPSRISHARKVREIGPGVSEVVIDLEVSKA